MWNEHVRDCWEKPEMRDAVVKQTDEENERVLVEWKKRATFTGSAEDFDQQ